MEEAGLELRTATGLPVTADNGSWIAGLPGGVATAKAGHKLAPSFQGLACRSGLREGRFSPLLLLFLLCQLLTVNCKLLHAQTTNATLTGQVTDTSGAAVPNADVIAINDATNVHYQTKTNNDGIYVEPNLPPGTYHVEVTKEGFKNVIQPSIELHVQDGRSANYTLQVGAQSETVTVQESSFLINTQDASVSTTIDRNFAENLPLNGRSFQTLILLTPGTVQVSVKNNGGQFSVNGQRANANSFAVDGVSANLGGFLNQSQLNLYNGANPSLTLAGSTQGLVSVDALQEFKIQTSTYAPEFGRQPGGQISLLTRSGTNSFHGTGFDYFRNTILDANNWFNDAQSLPKGVDKQNDFGGTIGGPILRDNTFFFFSYEGLRLLLPTTADFTVPSLRVRQEAATSFQPILNSFPTPDGPETIDPSGNPTGGAPYTLSQSFPTTLDSYALRIDHAFGKQVHLFSRYADTVSKNQSENGVTTLETEKLRSRSLTIGMDASLKTTLQNETRINYTVNSSSNSDGFNLIGGGKSFDTTTFFPSPLKEGVDSTLWQLQLPGVTASSNPGPIGNFSQRQIAIVDNLSHSLGLHQLKWGVDYRRLFPIIDAVPLYGEFFVESEADLIAGTLSDAFLGATLTVHPIFTNFSAFGQDTWRVSHRLFVTYGLRWDFNPTPHERDGLYPPNAIGFATGTPTFVPAGTSPLFQTTRNNFAPRIGAAYQVRQSNGYETVVRGGFGVFYDLNSDAFTNSIDQSNTSQDLTGVPFPVSNNVFAAPPLPVQATPPYRNVRAVDPNLQLPYTLQWNISIEQALGKNQTLSSSYIAAAGRRLLRNDELLNVNASFPAISVLRNAAASNYQSLQLQFNRRLAEHLQGIASYTYSHSIDNASDGVAVYTALHTTTGFPDPNVDRGNSDFDLRHAFRTALTYDLPSWRAAPVARALLGGWSIDTIAVAQSGLPQSVYGSRPRIRGFQFFERANIVSGQPFYLNGPQCAAAHGGAPCPGGRGFNAAAFAPVPTVGGLPQQDQGTSSRNMLYGLSTWQMDFALHRQFNITERFRLQFRGEFFNVFNHPNFVLNGGLVTSNTFGIATQMLNTSLGTSPGSQSSLYTLGGPRSAQLALKMFF